MKLDLNSSSKGFSGAGFLALVFHEWVSKTPAWIGDCWAILIWAGLALMLAHKMTIRRQRAEK